MGRNRKKTSIGAVEYTIFNADDITKQLGDWSTYPAGAARMFEEGAQTVSAYLENDPAFNAYVRDYLQLDPNNFEHVEVVAALMGITSGDRIFIEDDRIVQSSGVDSSANVVISPSANGTVDVDIYSFAKRVTSRQKRLAYSMIRRMVWGMRRYAEINGVPPAGMIYLQAESDDMAMNGVQTWGKLGFNFSMRGDLEDAARQFGFAGRTSQEIMMERNQRGQSGFEAWNDIVQQVVNDQGSASADGEFNVADNSVSMMVLAAYGNHQKTD